MYTSDFAQVGANIQKCLVRKHMSQQQLADLLGISKQVTSKIVNGSKAINVTELTRIAQVLDTTAEELLTAPDGSDQEDSMSFMGSIDNEKTLEKVKLLRVAIDEILMLEDLLNA
ncbi:MAG: helix-turn-helix transcriptional regulator [Clostridia bacterium]|nr:helix-turn-helix transcriptional regulator [Clostridia bacterium]